MSTAPWLAAPICDTPQEVLVVGAGIAGAAAAHALAERGCHVQVLERSEPGSGASGNPAAVLRPLLARDPTDPLARFYTEAFDCARAGIEHLRRLGHRIDGEFAGVLHCHPQPEHLRGDSAHSHPDLDALRTRLGGSLQSAGLWLPDGGWVAPQQYCQALLQHPNIRTLRGELQALTHDGLFWRLELADNTLSATHVVLANGWQLHQRPECAPLPLQTLAGQLMHYSDQQGLERPPVPIVGNATLSPCSDGWMAAAGYWNATTQAPPDPAHNAEILQAAHTQWHMPETPPAALRAAVRLTSRDHLPVVGGLPDFASAASLYADLAHGRPQHHYPAPPYLPNLFVLAALGGRGIGCAQYCAELLANTLFAESHPWQNALHPLRFLVRDLKRGTNAHP